MNGTEHYSRRNKKKLFFLLQRFLADVESFQRLVGDEVDISQFQLQIARAVITVFMA